VDDVEMNRDLLSRRLKQLGHEVEIAVNGREALEKIAATEFDLVLLDIMMPEVDGYKVLETLRGNGTLDRLPVIMISAVTEIDSVVRCVEMGATDYLPKPFNPVLLKARVGATLEKKRLRDRERLWAKSLERELDIGREIQASFLPEQVPQPGGWEIAARFTPARQVAGDFYDAFSLSGGSRIGLAVADVCDKGVGAALFMALFRSLIRAFAEREFAEPSGPDDDRILGTIVATNDYIALEVRQSRIDPGQTLLAFTDGVTEAKNPSGALYSEERLLGLLAESAPTAAALLDRIDAAVAAFSAGAERSDDITMLAVRRTR
jgi:serine phosphatase RsbU (regulator of sigma subunit)